MAYSCIDRTNTLTKGHSLFLSRFGMHRLDLIFLIRFSSFQLNVNCNQEIVWISKSNKAIGCLSLSTHGLRRTWNVESRIEVDHRIGRTHHNICVPITDGYHYEYALTNRLIYFARIELCRCVNKEMSKQTRNRSECVRRP